MLNDHAKNAIKGISTALICVTIASTIPISNLMQIAAKETVGKKVSRLNERNESFYAREFMDSKSGAFKNTKEYCIFNTPSVTFDVGSKYHKNGAVIGFCPDHAKYPLNLWTAIDEANLINDFNAKESNAIIGQTLFPTTSGAGEGYIRPGTLNNIHRNIKELAKN